MQNSQTTVAPSAGRFRFIDSGPLDAPTNMAFDEAMATLLAQRRNYGYLRFYRWLPAGLSFGYNQRIERLVELTAVRQAGFGIVRRMSGGKMVFHNDEHTFALGLTGEFIKERIGRTATFLDMFKFAIEPLVAALVKMGVPARFSSAREMMSGSSNHLHCYAAAAGHSVFAGQHKLIGAAGVFRNDCLIIHGSIPINISFPAAELFTAGNNPQLDVEMAALSSFISQEKIDQLPLLVAEAYADMLQALLETAVPDDQETAMIAELAREKYSDLNWHKKGVI